MQLDAMKYTHKHLTLNYYRLFRLSEPHMKYRLLRLPQVK